MGNSFVGNNFLGTHSGASYINSLLIYASELWGNFVLLLLSPWGELSATVGNQNTVNPFRARGALLIVKHSGNHCTYNIKI